MKKRIICILLFFCITLTYTFSNKYVDLVEDKALGFSFTNAFNDDYMVLGLSYQQWFSNGLGFQVVAGGGDAKYNIDPFYCAEIELQKMFYAYKLDNLTTTLYGWLNTGYCSYLDYAGYEYDSKTDNYYTKKETLSVIGLGLGFGVDFILSNNFSLPVKIGYITSYSSVDDYMMNVSLNLGIRYRF